MISLLLALSMTCGQTPPQNLELFANEGFYKEQKGKEQPFTGTLSKIQRAGGVVGFGRFNPFTLKMADGKVREVYVGGKLNVLDPYVGKKVTLVGKAVDMEVEGRQHHEIWPARLEVVSVTKKLEGGTSSFNGSTTSRTSTTVAAEGAGDGPKILAKAAYKIGNTSTVFRSAEELAKLNVKPADVARFLKVDNIDFSKQMIVVISGGSRPTGGYGVELKGAAVKDKVLTVSWVLKTPPPGAFVTQAFTHPMLVVLMERFDGKVAFDPAAPPKAGKRPLQSN